MLRPIQYRPALGMAVTGLALAGALAVTGTASAASVTGAPSHSGVARDAGAKPHRTARHTHLGRSRAHHRPATTSSNWPMFQATPGHSGVSPETVINTSTASSLIARRTEPLGTPSYTSPAVVWNGSLRKALVYAGGGNHFYAYPTGGGAAAWTYKLPAGVVETSPAVFDGVVYFGSTAGTFFALNASTGALMCSRSTGHAILASPVVVSARDGSGPVLYDGTIPTSGNPGAEWAIYGPGNRHGACAEDWEFTNWGVFPGGSWSPPAYGTGANGVPLLVFGSKDRDDSVYALNATTGALVWRYRTNTLANSDVGAPPTISPPGYDGFAGGAVYVTGKDKVVYALNLTTGSLIWQHALATGTNGDLSGTALVGSQVYLGSDTGVYALNARTGAQVWHVLPQSTFYASPVVTGPAGRQVLLSGDTTGHLYALRLTTGATLWTQKPTNEGFWGSPAVSQGAFYIAGLDGHLRGYAPGS